MGFTVSCEGCGKTEVVAPSRKKTYRFCSHKCLGEWRSEAMKGENHPLWHAGERERTCQECGNLFTKAPTRAMSLFVKQKFCSKACADVGGLRYSGPDNGNWSGNARRTHRGPHAAWAKAVISRDNATCQKCGIRGVELHAHHINPYNTHPDLRDDVSNGLTLCFSCHWAEHTGSSANGVNSGEAASGHAGGNPEPSFDGNVVEGVTTRGRAYRRWEGNCEFCGTFLSKRLSNTIGKAHHYCSKTCSKSDYWRRWREAKTVHGSNASTSSPAETHDIVWPHVKA